MPVTPMELVGVRVEHLAPAGTRPRGATPEEDRILAEQLDSRNRPCNFVELMPRLQEK